MINNDGDGFSTIDDTINAVFIASVSFILTMFVIVVLQNGGY